MHEHGVSVPMWQHTCVISGIGRRQSAQSEVAVGAPAPLQALRPHGDSAPPRVHVQGPSPVEPPDRGAGAFAPHRAAQRQSRLRLVVLLA